MLPEYSMQSSSVHLENPLPFVFIGSSSAQFRKVAFPKAYSVLRNRLRNLLLQKMKVPSVVVEGDIVDLRVFNVDEAYAKMDAFIETMDHYREVRKKEGFDW